MTHKHIRIWLSSAVLLLSSSMAIVVQAQWLNNGTHMYNSNTGNVGIGTGTSFTPSQKFHVDPGGSNTSAGGILVGAIPTGSSQLYMGVAASGAYAEIGSSIIGVTPANRLILNRVGGTVGIGTATPNAPLQFASTDLNRKLVLKEIANTDHQVFGFGVNATLLRYQVADNTGVHAFYAGNLASASTGSNEIMRITGTGNVGIGTNAPNAPLQFASTNVNRKIVLFEVGNNDNQVMGFGATSTSLNYQVANNTGNHIFYAGNAATASAGSRELMRIVGLNGNVGIGTTSPAQKLHINPAGIGGIVIGGVGGAGNTQLYLGLSGQTAGYSEINSSLNGPPAALILNRTGGNIGIGATTSPNALLQFPVADANRKLVLKEVANSDHQVFGFGVSTTLLRYQVADNTGVHAFYAGNLATASTGSNELMRITGTGNVGIGTTAPNASLQFASTNVNRKIVLFEVGNNDNQVMGFGANATSLIYQVANNTGNHSFFAGSAASASTSSVELMRISGNGNVGIGLNGAAPTAKLHVAGDMLVTGNIQVTTGKVRTNDICVTPGGSCDFVFNEDYKLNSISELKEFIKKNKHLPHIQSEKDIVTNGTTFNTMVFAQLRTVEELVLYTIQQQEALDKQGEKIKEMEKILAKLLEAQK